MMLVSKWKVTRFLFPITMFIVITLITSSFRAQLVSEKSSITNDNAQNRINCSDKWNSLFPSDSTIGKIIEQQLFDTKRTSKPFDQNERMLALLPKKENELLFNGPLIGVYNIDTVGPAMSKNETIDNRDDYKAQNSADVKFLLNSYPNFQNNLSLNEPLAFPKLLDSIHGENQIQLHFYNAEKTYQTHLTQIKYKTGDCDDVLYYEFDKSTFSEEESSSFLLASSLRLNIVFKNFPKVDELFKNILPEECLDCPNNLSQLKTYGKLNGFEHIYFVFTDLSSNLIIKNEPARGLVFIEEAKTPRFLWYESIDLFGCSCL